MRSRALYSSWKWGFVVVRTSSWAAVRADLLSLCGNTTRAGCCCFCLIGSAVPLQWKKPLGSLLSACSSLCSVCALGWGKWNGTGILASCAFCWCGTRESRATSPPVTAKDKKLVVCKFCIFYGLLPRTRSFVLRDLEGKREVFLLPGLSTGELMIGLLCRMMLIIINPLPPTVFAYQHCWYRSITLSQAGSGSSPPSRSHSCRQLGSFRRQSLPNEKGRDRQRAGVIFVFSLHYCQSLKGTKHQRMNTLLLWFLFGGASEIWRQEHW